jgi:uncharacterized surface protein with fasciclin (FAS1) repeats
MYHCFICTAWDLLDIAAQQEATEFLQLVSDAKLTKTMQLLDNVTLFLPSNKAIQVVKWL